MLRPQAANEGDVVAVPYFRDGHAAVWAGEHTALLNTISLGLTALGVVVQLFLDWLRARMQKERKQREDEQARLVEERHRKKGILGFLRKAG